MNAITDIEAAGNAEEHAINASQIDRSLLQRIDGVHNYNSWTLARKLGHIYGFPVIMAQLIGLFAAYQLSQIETMATGGAISAGELASSVSWSQLVIYLMMGFTFVVTILGAMRINNDIIGSIKRLTQASLRLVRGEKSFEIPDTDRWDELGEMARSLRVFQRGYFRLDKLRQETAAKAEAELDVQKQREREREEMIAEQARVLLELADKFENTVADVVGGVAAASTQLQATASTMASAAEQAAQQTGEVAKAMEEASSGVTAAAAASDEFAMSINEISRQAATSAELARKATTSAEQADSTISNLSERANEVSQIVELISSIAQRTNLLALNASIEAARGGEAGRGFAVVASEVKELANQTSKATEEVAEQVRAMQDSTQASVGALHLIGDQIKSLEATAVSIASAVDQQSVAGQDLARSIDLAARSTDNVSANIVQVRQASLSTGSAASQVLNSATELEEQAATLRSQVNEFLAHIRNT